MTAEQYIADWDADGRTVGEVLDAFLEMAALPSAAEPTWERVLFDLEPSGEEHGYLALHRDVVEVEDDGVEEDPVTIGWTLTLDIGGEKERIEGRPPSLDGVAEDAPAMDLGTFAELARAVLAEREVLASRPIRVVAVS